LFDKKRRWVVHMISSLAFNGSKRSVPFQKLDTNMLDLHEIKHKNIPNEC